jgi:NAD+ kinase
VQRAVLHRRGRAAGLARSGHLTARRLVAAAREQDRTLAAVEAALGRRGLFAPRVAVDRIDAPARRLLARARFVVTVGGDGTLLTASHHVAGAAVLAVNSAPADSVGHFCLTDRRDFAATLDAIEGGRLRPTPVRRLGAALDGRPLAEPVLNDLLVTHQNPAATSRYRLAARGRAEEHRSSGLWIATAAGSTAGIRSAGGRVLPLRSRRLQFRARELYRERRRAYRLHHGFLGPGEALVVDSKMEAGFVYLDGARTAYPFPFGARLRVSVAPEPFLLFAPGRPRPRRGRP